MPDMKSKLILLCAEKDCLCERCGNHARFVLQYSTADTPSKHRIMLCDQHLKELAASDDDLFSRLLNGLGEWLEDYLVMVLA